MKGHADVEVRLLTVREVARLLGMSVRTIHRMRSANRLPAPVKLPGSRSLRFDKRDLEQFIEGLKGGRNGR